MSDVAIVAESLGKKYRLGKQQRYRTLRDTVAGSLAAMLRRLQSAGSVADGPSRELWALHDVSFEIPRGEVVGVIGRNGAGKSTLLKILSRITEPTVGRAEIQGRVGSLLEVGTGFHPELTGRENIFLNGAIIGMRRAEIIRLFDEIVAFAEVGDFVDTAIKHYSSGMYLRLAFAVAAHLNPEILLVDEVLAVGDVAFQKKCMGKMGDVARGGRTILLVSHSLPAIESLCRSCLVFDKGGLQFAGPTARAIERYLAQDREASGAEVQLVGHPGRTKDSKTAMESLTLYDEADNVSGAIRMGARLSLSIRFANDAPLVPMIGVVVRTNTGTPVFGINNRIVQQADLADSVSRGVMTIRFESVQLMPGSYTIDLFFGDGYRDFDIVEGAASFEVLPADVFGSGKLAPRWTGAMYCPATFALSDGR